MNKIYFDFEYYQEYFKQCPRVIFRILQSVRAVEMSFRAETRTRSSCLYAYALY